MLVELGNTAAPNGLDDRPKVTTIQIPEFDASGAGGYTHTPGAISVPDFKAHRQEAADFRSGITRLPDSEILLACVNAWSSQSAAAPAWVSVRSHQELTGEAIGHAPQVAADVQGFLREFYGLAADAGKPADLEFTHWTRFGQPGQGEPIADPRPDVQMLYTDAGRVISNINDGGGQVGFTAAATASSATSLTDSGAAWTTNQWAGYRVYAQSSTSNMVWANVLSNTATVLTVDRWYAAATPGGSAGSTPSSTSPFLIADGGSVSSWFVGLTSTNITPAHGDTSMSGEITTASSGLLRKIAPYAQTSGVASRSITLTPVYTATSSDTFPTTVYAIGVFVSMVVSSTPLCMKFETSLNASATINAIGDQITVTETITGS